VVDFGLSKAALARQFHTTPRTIASRLTATTGIDLMLPNVFQGLAPPSRMAPKDHSERAVAGQSVGGISLSPCAVMTYAAGWRRGWA
jgi:hypothetical protein